MTTFLSKSLGCLAAAALLLADSGCIKQVRERHYLSAANSDFEAGRYDQAESGYLKALQINNNDPVANRRLGTLYHNEGKELLAFSYLRRAQTLSPDNAEVRLKLGQIYLGHYEFTLAADAAKAVLESLPGNEDALLLLVGSARQPADLDRIRQQIEKLRAGDQDRASYHAALGALDVRQRNASAAETEFRQAVAMDPKDSLAYGQLGEILYYVHRDPVAAGQDFKTSMDLAPLRSTAHLRYIEFLAQTGHPDAAKQQLADLTKQAPDYIPALSWVARIAFQEKRYDDCAAALQKILSQEPFNYTALVQRGVLERARGDFAAAITDLKSAQRYFKNDVQLQFELALAYLQHGDTALGRNGLSQVIALDPKLEEPVLLMADLDLKEGNGLSAVGVLTDWLANGTPSVRAYELLARAYALQHNAPKALDTYARMKAANPKNPDADYRMGVIYYQLGDLAAARKACLASLAVVADYAPALELQLNLDLREKHFAAAESWVGAMALRYPKSSTPWLFKAKIALSQTQPAAAETDLLKAIDLEPRRQDAYFQLAGIYVVEGKAQAALDKLLALVNKSSDPQAMLQAALIQDRLQKYADERAMFQKILALDPKNSVALNDLAYDDVDHLGLLDEASTYAKQAKELEPDSYAVSDTQGWIAFKQGDYTGAVVLLQQAADKAPTDPDIQYHLGMAHYLRGEADAATTAFQACVTSPQDSLYKADARQRLAVLTIDVRNSGAAARAQLELRLHADPTDPIALAKLGQLEVQGGDPKSAAARFETALKASPRNSALMEQLALLYAGPLKDPDHALALAKSAHEISPDDAPISQTLGHLLYQAGDYERSLALLRDATPDAATQPEYEYDLARDFYYQGLVPDADAALQAVLQSPAAFSRREEAQRFAAMLAAGKSPALAAAAADDAKKLLASAPNEIAAEMVVGLAAEQAANYQAARDTYEKILAADRAFAPATRQLALLYGEKLGDDQKAYDLTIRAREAFPADAELAGALGILDYRRADYAGAANLFSESLSHRPNDPEIVYYLGMAHYQMKDFDSAKQELKQALDLNVADSEAEEARRTLEELQGGYHGPSLSAQPIN